MAYCSRFQIKIQVSCIIILILHILSENHRPRRDRHDKCGIRKARQLARAAHKLIEKQGLLTLFRLAGASDDTAATLVSISLIFLSALLTGLSVYDDIASFAGAGTLVPITGFANSIVAPAVEFRTEGVILGTCAKMFTIAGPVLVFGTLASVVYGLIYWLVGVLL